MLKEEGFSAKFESLRVETLGIPAITIKHECALMTLLPKPGKWRTFYSTIIIGSAKMEVLIPISHKRKEKYKFKKMLILAISLKETLLTGVNGSAQNWGSSHRNPSIIVVFIVPLHFITFLFLFNGSGGQSVVRR